MAFTRLVCILLATAAFWNGAEAAFYCWFLNPPQQACRGESVCSNFVSGQCNVSDGKNESARDSFIFQCPEDGGNGDVQVLLFHNDPTCGEADREESLPQGKCEVFGQVPEDNTTRDRRIPLIVNCTDSITECFSSQATTRVLLPTTHEVVERSLDQVSVGDAVESFDAQSGERVFSEVFLVQHADSSRMVPMLDIAFQSLSGTSTGNLHVTQNHYLIDEGGKMLKAGELRRGSRLRIYPNGASRYGVAEVTDVQSTFNSVRNVHTMNDHIIVDGVVASCYAEVRLGPVNLGRLPNILFPFKVLHRLGLSPLAHRIDSTLHQLYVSSHTK